MKRPAPEECPVCGADIDRNALSCPECGACHETGWKDDADESLFEDESDFNYNDYVEKEFGKRPAGIPPWAWIVGVVLLIALFFRAFR